jgi:hypothetical protein
MWLTALVNALPAIGNIVKDVVNHDDKAGQAAQVAADPNAPPAVKQAAANVAANAIDQKAAAEKAAVAAAAGKAPQQAGDNTALYVALGIGALFLLGKRR